MNRPQSIPLDSCREIGLDLRKLSEPMLRSFLDCLDGKSGNLAGYKKLLDVLSRDDISILIHIYNAHMVDESRFKKALELFSKMNELGYLESFTNSFASLVESGVLRDLIPIFSHFYELEDGQKKPAVEFINKVIVDSMERGVFTDLLLTLGKLFDSGRMRMLISLMAQVSENPIYGLNEAVDEIANAFYLSMESGGFQEISMILGDPINHRVFKETLNSIDGSTAGINAYFEYLTDQSSGRNRLWDIIQLTRLTDRPAICFESSGTSSRVENIFDLGLAEVRSRNLSTNEELAEFYIEEAPFHLKNLEYQCKLPIGLNQHYLSFIDLIQVGFGTHINQMELSFDSYGRLDYLKRLIGSPQLNSISNLVQNSKQRNILAYILDLLSKNLTEEDYRVFAKLNYLLYVEDLTQEESVKWVDKNIVGDLRERSLEYLVSQKRGLIDLLFWIDEEASHSQQFSSYSEQIRKLLVDYEFVNAPAMRIVPILQKTFSAVPKYRIALKRFAKSLVESWSRPRDSFSDWMASIAGSLILSRDKPIQDFIKNVLSDQEFVEKVNPVLLRLANLKELIPALDLTAKLGRSGEFTRLLLFLNDISRSLPLDSLSPVPLGKDFSRFKGDYHKFYSSYSYVPKSLQKNYDSCHEILKHTSPWNSSYLKNLAICLSGEEGGDLSDIISTLENIYVNTNQNVLDVLGSMMSTHFLQSPLFFQALEDLKIIHRSENLEKLFGFLLSFKDSSSPLLNSLELMLARSCHNQEELESTAWMADVLLKPSTPLAAKATASLLLEEKEKHFSGFRMLDREIQNDDFEEIYSKFRKWKKDIRTESFQKVDDEYLQQKINEYEKHNEEYLYGQGLYTFPGANSEEKAFYYSSHLVPILRYASRGESIYALAKSFESLDNRKFPWKDFFDWTTGKSRIVRYWHGENKTPFVRIVSPLEQAEILVKNSRIAVARNLPGLGVNEVGSYFQIELAKSKNLKSTLKKLKAKIDLGLTYAKLFGKKEKWVHLRNIKENFSVLEELHELGFLDLFVEIYKNLYEATPSKDRVQDRERIYSSLIHEPMSFGILSDLSFLYQSLKKQNMELEVLDLSINSVRSLSRLDTASVRKLIQTLIQSENESFLLTEMIESFTRNSSHWSAEDSLNSITALLRLSPNPNLAFPLLRQILSTGSERKSWLEFLFFQISDQDGELARVLNNLHGLDNLELVAFQEMGDSLAKQDLWLESLVKEIYSLWKEDPESFSTISREFRVWRIENKDDMRNYLIALRESIEMAKLGLLPVLSEFLRSDISRAGIKAGFCGIVSEGKSKDILSLIEKFKNGSSLDKIFSMLERHFKR